MVYGVSNSIFFGVYHNVFKHIEEENPLNYVKNYKLWVLHVWEASFIAGLAQVTFANPFEVMKTQMQGRTGTDWKVINRQWGKHMNTNINTFEVMASIFKANGIRGFYVGYLPLALRYVLYIRFTTINYIFCMVVGMYRRTVYICGRLWK